MRVYILIGEIGLDCLYFNTVPLCNLVSSLFKSLLIARDHDDVKPTGCKLVRKLKAYTVARSGDDDP
jgi:hypothetical protein